MSAPWPVKEGALKNKIVSVAKVRVHVPPKLSFQLIHDNNVNIILFVSTFVLTKFLIAEI